MKYYIYISDTKVDMLYPQIPQSLLKKIATNLNIDLKLPIAEFIIANKGNPSDETRYSKVRIVSEYIENHLDVGTVDAPSTYFNGKLPMGWEIFSPKQEEQKTVYFGGISAHTILGLGGSPEHIIGNKPKTSDGPKMTSSNLGVIATVLYRKFVVENDSQTPSSIDETGNSRFLVSAALAVKHVLHPTQQLEFLAKTLLQGSLPPNYMRSYELEFPQSYVVVGTPIYVAIAD